MSNGACEGHARVLMLVLVLVLCIPKAIQCPC